MLFAQRHNVPGVVLRTILLDMSPEFRFLEAQNFGTMQGEMRAAEMLPMLKPTATPACIVPHSVNVLHFHDSSLPSTPRKRSHRKAEQTRQSKDTCHPKHKPPNRIVESHLKGFSITHHFRLPLPHKYSKSYTNNGFPNSRADCHMARNSFNDRRTYLGNRVTCTIDFAIFPIRATNFSPFSSLAVNPA